MDGVVGRPGRPCQTDFVINWSAYICVCVCVCVCGVYHSNVTESVPSAYNQRYNLEITYQKNDVEWIGMSQN
jgi:hypothetical protein